MSLDWKHPDYVAEFRRRSAALVRIREDRSCLPALRVYYRNHPADFISDWGVTIDPRNVERGLPAVIPFVLFPKQREWIDWTIDLWKSGKPGLTEKTRDMGMSWVSVSLACTLCVFYRGVAIGFGSRKEEYVDKIGAPKSLFYKARAFMANVPVEFRAGWTEKDAPHMRINFPATGSNICGEAGDNIGRGDRTSIYVVDEAAYLERPQLVEASLSQTTNCRIDISSANGMGNAFAQKRFSGRVPVFTFHWRDDPRKDDAWYEKQVAELDPVTVAQEIDIDYAASVEGTIIPSAWIASAVNACEKLNVRPTGERWAALDVADEGKDLNALCVARGVEVEAVDAKSGLGSDILRTVQETFLTCDVLGIRRLRYDGDGLGAGVRGDARVLNEQRIPADQVKVEAFRGSEGVFEPKKQDVPGRDNEDFFANCKAQAWWSLRARFQRTHRWVTEGIACDPDSIVSLSPRIRDLGKLCVELAQPTYRISQEGKVVVEKTPPGTKSPNRADSVMMRFAPITHTPMTVHPEVLQALKRRL